MLFWRLVVTAANFAVRTGALRCDGRTLRSCWCSGWRAQRQELPLPPPLTLLGCCARDDDDASWKRELAETATAMSLCVVLPLRCCTSDTVFC
eukprot:4728766-Pleurochrysis_carterae.AAC.1